MDDDLLLLVQSYVRRSDKQTATAVECGAWESFHPECTALIGATVRRIRAAKEATEDLIQDVWAAVIHGLPEFCPNSKRGTFESWVTCIALRKAWRCVQRRSRRQEEPLAAGLAAELRDSRPGPDFELERIQQQELLSSRLAEFAETLSERDRVIFMLRVVDHRAIYEITRELNLTDDCVRSALRRALVQLGASLRACGINHA
jgi:RNA polymerase sigma factor (sigma-70 family)